MQKVKQVAGQNRKMILWKLSDKTAKNFCSRKRVTRLQRQDSFCVEHFRLVSLKKFYGAGNITRQITADCTFNLLERNAFPDSRSASQA
jgi:hypothetical protein